ncbi:MAG: alkaline phosphatase family protein [Acidobacteriota bacterium]|nr:alkaline phosphatase family protein [Blastocatellia bacterium]MDW8412806.1 alkaline phosphatase family protein [Acidobacteriota bacterium]
MRKVIVIGLDCAAPQLVFDAWREELPNIKSLVERGVWGKLRSTDPPITVPAWMSMLTSKNPGRLGFYGLRNRVDYSYTKMSIPNSMQVKEPTVWQILSERGKRCIVIGVPQTYPPRPLNGYLVSCFLTPSTKNDYTYPVDFKREVEQVTGGYILDCDNFRTDEKQRILDQIFAMTQKRFRLAEYCLSSKPWDFFIMVEMGIDRIHHGFWKYMDKTHPKHEPGNPFENVIKDYYKFCDEQIGSLLRFADGDTTVMVVSDHGARKMDGGICINEWLIKEGYLVLKEWPSTPQPIEKCMVDWEKTKAWGSGGYYARLMINVKGREPQGVVALAEYESLRAELISKLEAIPSPDGRKMRTRVVRPEDVYPEVRNIPPDLFVYFDDLNWRSVGSVGSGEIYTFENDTGPDDANHDWYGIFVMAEAGRSQSVYRDDLDIKDVAPTILHQMGIEVPKDMEGKVIQG